MKKTPIIPEIVQQFSDDSAFLALQRKKAHENNELNFLELWELERRLNAHLHGLHVSGAGAWPILEDNLSFEEYGEFFSATVFLLARSDSILLVDILELASSNPSLEDAIVDAFIWVEYDKVENQLTNLLIADEILANKVAIRALGGHRKITELQLQAALCSTDSQLLTSAVVAVSENGMDALYPIVNGLIEHDDEHVQFHAAWASARFGCSQAMDKLKQFVTHESYSDAALQYVCMQKDTQNTVALLQKLYGNEETISYAIAGLAYLGNPKTIPSLIELMSEEASASAAAHAFSLITGVDLVESEMVVLKIDDETELNTSALSPELEKIKLWWGRNHAHFELDKRYFLGQPFSKSHLIRVVGSAKQQYRAYSALCLAIYQPGEVMINVCSPCYRQK